MVARSIASRALETLAAQDFAVAAVDTLAGDLSARG
jgi:hypothetical protein